MPPVQPNVLGTVCDEWDYSARRCATTATVYQIPGKPGAHFLTKMAIDADGAPKGYHPGEYYPSNAYQSFDWLDNLNSADAHGVQGANAPAPGFLVSGTALTDSTHYPATDPRCYVDASSIPYIVLTGSRFPVPAGTVLTKGCVALVVDTQSGIYSGAIYADVGRAVGEASLALSLMLNIDPFSRRYWPKVTGGVSQRRIFYLVFPQVVIPPPWDVAQIQSQAWTQFQEWGGEPQLKFLFPAMPNMTGPRPVIIRPLPASVRDLDGEADQPNIRLKGSDVPKQFLEEED
jgi:hypothetical protein